MIPSPPIAAAFLQSLPLGALQTRTVVDLMRRHELTEWWHWWLLAIVCTIVVIYTTWMYRRDAAELPRGVRTVLLLLRVTAFAGLLLFFLDLERRTERQVTRASRVVVLVDTSQSMGLADSTNNTGTSRLNQVIDEFSNGHLLSDLQQKHDVLVYRFDQLSAPQSVVTFPKVADEHNSDDADASTS